MIRRWGGTTLAGLLLAAGLGGTAHAVVRYVDDDGQDPFECTAAPYSSISAAIAEAKPGDEIRVCPGTYPEQLVITKQLRITGISFGTARPVIQPTSLPETRPSLLGPKPITAGILIDDSFVKLTNLDVDLSQNASEAGCSVALAGVYLRKTSGEIDRLAVHGVRVPGDPDCDSGVGLYVESGQIGEVLGKPVYGQARVYVRETSFADFQKAGLVGNGPRTVLTVKGGSVDGDGISDAPVQNGYQIGYGATARMTGMTITGLEAPRPDKAASGVLIYQSGRVSMRDLTVEGVEEGVFAVGDRNRVKKSSFSTLSGDGAVFLGDANLASGNLIEDAGVSAVFVNGDGNSVRGGVMRDLALGIWFQSGIGNVWTAITFDNVPVAGQGVYGGNREFGPEKAAPFTTN